VTEIPPPREALTDNLKATFENIDRGLVDFGEHNRLWLPLITFLLAQLDRFVEALTKALAQPIPPPAPAREPMLTAPAKPPRPRKPAPRRLKFGWLLDLMPGAFVADAAIAQPREIPTDLPEYSASIAPIEPEPTHRRVRLSIFQSGGREPQGEICLFNAHDAGDRFRPPKRNSTRFSPDQSRQNRYVIKTKIALSRHIHPCPAPVLLTGRAQ